MALPDHVMDIIDPSMLFSEEVNDREISPDHIEERAVITYNDPNVSIQSLEIEEYLVSVMRIGLASSTTFPRERMAMKDVLKNLVSYDNLLLRLLILSLGIPCQSATYQRILIVRSSPPPPLDRQSTATRPEPPF
ncbi:hypothetical protein EZV62_016613 [Acer yangbiense]|uniref:Uncharacterized protein n=1 Tax=Acer yangbiense TaxID=1000413 RepID=A0A5C7HPN0_9ROSI|nr:hypothetical protein EZV62_016613 [Acer yangbiense]